MDTKLIYEFLVKKSYDFMVQLPVPDNHFFHHFSSGTHNADFYSRISYYETHGVDPIKKCPQKASQFVIICPEENGNYNLIRNHFSHLKVLRATSPIDNKSVWIEILPDNVSKATGIEHIRKMYNVNIEDINVVGNDYYDLDMLNYVNKERAFVVSNAPSDLKNIFNCIESNEQNGVANLIDRLY